jgi:hypothetical protein
MIMPNENPTVYRKYLAFFRFLLKAPRLFKSLILVVRIRSICLFEERNTSPKLIDDQKNSMFDLGLHALYRQFRYIIYVRTLRDLFMTKRCT